MGIMTNLLLSFVHLVLLALDIICFFVIIRMLCHRVNRAWLKTFDSVGGPLVDLYVSYLQKAINRISSKTFSQAALLNIAMLTLVIARIFLVALFSK
jgi:hypothetical protein